MKKYIVLSANDNPEYLFYLPLTVWAWKKFGWDPIIFYYGDRLNPNFRCALGLIWMNIRNVFLLNDEIISGYRSDMVAQISRLYGACVQPEGYLMTGDIDMIPLSDYWKFDENVITIWGHDLTGYQHIPICYIGMPSKRWVEVMGLSSFSYNGQIRRDLESMPNAKCGDRVKEWVVDQDLITQRISQTEFIVNSIPRGTGMNGYPIGRVDRSAWSLNQPQFIDCHMLRGIYRDSGAFLMTMDLLHKIWPEEDFKWFEKYTEQFKKML